MANFKGGFAFNNGPAKVEVEQAPDGTLISCVNPVTGESLGGGGSGGVEIITDRWLQITNSSGSSRNISCLWVDQYTPAGKYAPASMSHSTGGSNIKWLRPVLINGEMLFTVQGTSLTATIINASVTSEVINTGFTTFHIVPDSGTSAISMTYTTV